MSVDSGTKNKIDAIETAVDNITARLDILERENAAKVTSGSLKALSDKVALDIANLAEIVRRVESKVGHIKDPKETIALLGVEDLRNIKTHLRQLLVIKQELDDMRKQLIDMLTAYDMGQATTLDNI